VNENENARIYRGGFDIRFDSLLQIDCGWSARRWHNNHPSTVQLHQFRKMQRLLPRWAVDFFSGSPVLPVLHMPADPIWGMQMPDISQGIPILRSYWRSRGHDRVGEYEIDASRLLAENSYSGHQFVALL